MPNIQFLTADRASFPVAAASASSPLSIQESDPAVRYGGGAFAQQDANAGYYGGFGNYTTVNGAWCEVTIPSGYTRLKFEGINSGSGANFDVTKNGTLLGSGDEISKNLYYDALALAAGDIIRFTKTSGPVLFVDQFTFLPS